MVVSVVGIVVQAASVVAVFAAAAVVSVFQVLTASWSWLVTLAGPCVFL